MDSDALTTHQLVCYQHHVFVERDAKDTCHLSTERLEATRRHQVRHVLRKHRVQHAELVLLIEIGSHEPPRCTGFEPFKKSQRRVVRDAMLSKEVTEWKHAEVHVSKSNLTGSLIQPSHPAKRQSPIVAVVRAIVSCG